MFSSEVFFVAKVRATEPKTFIVRDQAGHSLDTPLYRQNLIRAEPGYEKHKRVLRIISRRGIATSTPEFLVEYEGKAAPQEWISKTQLDAYKQHFS